MFIDIPYACDPEELVYAERLEKLHEELQSGHPQVSVLAYHRLQFLSYSTLCWGTVKFECKIRADEERPFFLGFHNQKFYTVPKEERSRLYVGVPE